jgi:hypothetical protein
VWLETALGFPALAASGIVAAAQFLGAAGRIGSGVLSVRPGEPSITECRHILTFRHNFG